MSPARAHPRAIIRYRLRGFTLIELLVVIFIIGILLASVLTIIPKVKRAVYGAQTSAQLSALANAIQQYYNDYKAYPGPLPNSQLCAGYDTTPVSPYSTMAASGFQTLSAVNLAGWSNQNYNPGNGTFHPQAITGSQNLVLGLLGGLEMNNAAGGGYTFQYNANDIFTDGVNPAPRGPASLNTASPRRQQAYLQIKAGDISTPNTTYYGGAGASFVDATQDLTAANARSPQDAMIPVFLDKYSDPLPILYYRTNVGGSAIVGFRSSSTLNGAALTDPNISGGPNETAQYDLLQNMPYTASRIGTLGTLSTYPNSYHGLQGITATSNTGELLISSSTPTSPPVDTIDYNANGQNVPTNKGNNGLAYFKDPSLNNTTYDNLTSNVHLGVPRQKDGFVLISAGPDRLYGTHDDLIFPGPLQP